MASVTSLGAPLNIGAVAVQNRICIPPMVLYGAGGPGNQATEAHVAHYRALAQGGPGLIIQEATCVSPEGRLSPGQLGIWSDRQIPGLQAITEAVHQAGCPIFVQLHHGGLVSVGAQHLCPSAYRLQTPQGERRGREMTREEICRVRDDFIAAARRAQQAGYDGVELHGCHGYLLCQFLNPRVNRRTDAYGEPTLLVREILDGIRACTAGGFAVGVRLGAFEPGLAQGMAHAQALEAGGAEFLDVSYGFAGEMDLTAPGDPALRDVIRGAAEIRRVVSVPVFAVNGICTPAQAEGILEQTAVDMVDIGRSALVDPDWPRKALSGQQPGKCLGCQVCQWRMDPSRCPGRRGMEA